MYFSSFCFVHHIHTGLNDQKIPNNPQPTSGLIGCLYLLLFIKLGTDSVYYNKEHQDGKVAAGCKPVSAMHLHLKWQHPACVILTPGRWSKPANLYRVRGYRRKGTISDMSNSIHHQKLCWWVLNWQTVKVQYSKWHTWNNQYYFQNHVRSFLLLLRHNIDPLIISFKRCAGCRDLIAVLLSTCLCYADTRQFWFDSRLKHHIIKTTAPSNAQKENCRHHFTIQAKTFRQNMICFSCEH